MQYSGQIGAPTAGGQSSSDPLPPSHASAQLAAQTSGGPAAESASSASEFGLRLSLPPRLSSLGPPSGTRVVMATSALISPAVLSG